MNKLRLTVEKLLKHSISDDYVGTIANEIIEDVAEDVRTSADIDYNEDDVRLAIGRVLIDRMNIDY